MAEKFQHAEEIRPLPGRFKSSMRVLVRILYIFLPIWAIIFNLKLEYYLGLQLFTGTYFGIFVGISLVLVFLSVPFKKDGETMRWFDFVFAVAGFVPCIYFAWTYEAIVLTGGTKGTLLDVVLGTILVVTVLEAVRRTTGFFMVVVALFFIFHALNASMFSSFLRGPSVPFERFVIVTYQSASGIFGMIMRAVTTYLISFATFGAFMIALGAGEKFVNVALSLIGHVRGGAAKVSTISSAIVGTLTGCPMSNVGISGSFSIPMMKRTGFSPEFAAAVETTASVGGVIMPPMMGAIIFIMVELTGIAYVQIIKVALFPALLYFFAIYCQIDWYSKRNKMEGLPLSELPDRKKSLNESKFLFIIFALLIYFLVIAYLFPVRAAYYTLFYMIILLMFDKHSTVTLKKIMEGLEIATRNTLPVVPLAAAAGIILASISLTGTGIRLAGNIVQIGGGSLLGLTVLLAVACYILGLGISAMLAYILLATLVAPALIELGVPLIAAHFFIIYMGLSGFFTPPYAVVALTASAVGGAKFYPTCWKSMKLAVVAYLVPITLILDPVLLFQDVTLDHLIFRIIISVVSIYLLSAALEGYLHKRELLWFERITLGAGSVLLFIPYTQYAVAGGVICLATLALFVWLSRRHHSDTAFQDIR